MVDPIRVHGYESEAKRHHDNAKRAATYASQHLTRLLAALEQPPTAGALTYDARCAAALAAEASGSTQAYMALFDVRFLVEDEDNTDG